LAREIDMNILGISASPRRHGNSETLLDQALRGAGSCGAKTEKIILSKLDIKACHGSDSCFKKARCFVKDDMPGLLDKIARSDGIVLSSPIYFGSITAQLKTMIDRCQPLWVEKYVLKKKSPPKKRGAFLSVSSYDNKRFFENSKEIIDIFFRVAGIELVEALYFPGLESKGDAGSRKNFLGKAFRCGKKMTGV
jgi:multimeric flavodoxin WrbA